MNWVGGSRNRLVMKNDAKRQREFFEKRKMQQRLKGLGIAPPESQQGTSSGSMDLVTLFIVNRIAAKKENKDPPKVAVFGSRKGGSKYKRNEPLVLPMSPCSPSRLSLVESQHQDSTQATRKKKQDVPQGFNCRQLSPVLESAFSDNSASDYLPRINNPLSPFSSNSSASSGQGMFPLQLNLRQGSQMQVQQPPHCSLPPWDTSEMEQTTFHPFSQPRGMTDSVPWSCGSNPPLYQLETPNVLFGGPQPDNIDSRDHARYEGTFSLNQSEDREPMLDFTLIQSETEQQIEEAVFGGFSTEEREREASHFGSGKLKIHLKDDTPIKSSTLQTVPDCQCRAVEFSNCTDVNFSCLEHNNGPMNGCDCSPSYSCSRGYFSSDSNDEDECCQQSLQAASPHADQTCCTDSLNLKLGLQGNPKQKHTQPRIFSLLQNPKMNPRDDQKAMENVVQPDKGVGSNYQQMGNHTAQFVSLQALAQNQRSEPCKCTKTPRESQDAGTQTDNNPTATTCDASTQCSFVGDSANKATGFNLCLQPVDVSVQHPATRRQTDTAAEPNTHAASSGEVMSGGEHTPWKMTESRPGSLLGSSFINKVTADISDYKAETNKPPSTAEGRDERGRPENGCLMKDLSSEETEEVTSVTTVSRHSEEALQEIDNIFLLLKQK